jgi:hypothetical protein
MDSDDLFSIARANKLGLIHEAEVAKLRMMKLSSLRNERYRGEGPPFTRMGNKVFYPLDALRKFIAASTITPKRATTMVDGKRGSRARADAK